MKHTIILCLATSFISFASGSSAKASNVIIGSTNITVKLVRPGSAGWFGFHSTPCTIEEAPEKVIYFTSVRTNAQGVWTDTNWLAQVDDPYTKKSCVIAPFCDHVVSGKTGMTWFWVSGMDVLWRGSFFETSGTDADREAAITRFISGFKEPSTDDSRVLLRDAAPINFFWEGSSISMPVSVEKFDLVDGILRLDLLVNGGKGGKYNGDVDDSENDGRYHYWEKRPPHFGMSGSFWIDLKRQKVIKTVIDGYRMNLHTGNFAVPSLLAFPINPGTLRWGILPMAIALMMMAGTWQMSRKARTRFHYAWTAIALAGLGWSWVMLFRIYVLGGWPMEFPQDFLNRLGAARVSPKHVPQLLVAVMTGWVAVQALLLRRGKKVP